MLHWIFYQIELIVVKTCSLKCVPLFLDTHMIHRHCVQVQKDETQVNEASKQPQAFEHTSFHCLNCKHTHSHPFNGPFSGTTRVCRYQKGKTNLDFTGARESEWQWHQLGHMQVCTSHQTDKDASTLPLKFFTGRMLFLLPNQQHQSSRWKSWKRSWYIDIVSRCGWMRHR